MSTASTQDARSHARSQAASADLRIPTAPDGVAPVWAESVPAGSYTTRVLARGSRLRLSAASTSGGNAGAWARAAPAQTAAPAPRP